MSNGKAQLVMTLFGRQLACDEPWVLVLIPILIPLLIAWSYRSLNGLGGMRHLLALMLRIVVMICLVASLSNLQMRRISDKLTVLYLLDQSASIPKAQRDAMLRYVAKEVSAHRNDERGDRAGVIVFGREANIEIPPLDDDFDVLTDLETTGSLQVDATNLAGAMKLAQATFPEDSASRVVILTDGNENLGDVLTIAQLMVADGVGIDVVAVPLESRGDVSVERLALPVNIRKDQPFEARVVLDHQTGTQGGEAAPARGTLRLIRRRGAQEEVLDEPTVELQPGKSVFRFQHEIRQADFYEYDAQFVAEDAAQDRVGENNRATAFTHVRGQGQVLLVEDWENRRPDGSGEFQPLVEALRRMNLEVTVQFSDALFSSLAELQRYDTVILANVPRSSGNEQQVTSFSDAQVDILVQNTHETGCGLILLGGPSSFGAGGWSNTRLEEAMPVDFQVKNTKVEAVGALVMIMHASEIDQGNHWQKVIGREALKSLGNQDYCGLLHFDGTDNWLWGRPRGLVQVGKDRAGMIARLDKMVPGDMPDFDPSMRKAAAAFANLPEAAVKHMIIISDGDPSDPNASTLARLRTLGVTVTTVAVGAHGPIGKTPLPRIANATGGKYYVVNSAQALPRIYQREARRVARPLVKDGINVVPQVIGRHEILQGVEGSLPPIHGFVLTTRKENPLVEQTIVSPDPPDTESSTVLATWKYGLGRTVAFTTDAGPRWATQWTGWSQFDKFFGQMVRWSMRPISELDQFSVATQVRDGRIQCIVTALDPDDPSTRFLEMTGAVLGPDMRAVPLDIRQESAGRYVGDISAHQAGTYFLTLLPGAGKPPLRIGVTVPYSDEYRNQQTNEVLLQSITSLVPKGGQPGQLLDGSLTESEFGRLLQSDTFRPTLQKAASSRIIWPSLLVLAATVFASDVFIRRVALRWTWLSPLWMWLRGRSGQRAEDDASDARLQQLQARKREIGTDIELRRAATRFEAGEPSRTSTETPVDWGASTSSPTASPATPPQPPAEGSDQDSYTSRLLRAKREVWKDEPLSSPQPQPNPPESGSESKPNPDGN